MITEECSCGARLSLPAQNPAYGDKWRAVLDALSDWRAHHRHEFAPVDAAPLDAPLIHESSAFHERAPQYVSTENDIPFGFTRNA